MSPVELNSHNDIDFQRRFMEISVEEARKCVPEDNRIHPRVGVVIVRDGKQIATAYRGELDKGQHAEYTALEQKLSEQVVAGATVYTTLEPCTSRNHPKVPCADRLVERKIKRVVIGMLDPNDEICGKGIWRLRKANIIVSFFDSDLMSEIEEMNRHFIRQHEESLNQKRAAIENQIKELEKSKIEFERLRSEIEPRRITYDQRNTILYVLSTAVQRPTIVVIAPFLFDQESKNFAEQIGNVLKEAEWSIAINNTSVNDFKGISIACITAKQQPLPGYFELVNALKLAGINFSDYKMRDKSMMGPLNEGTILILVGRR
jgi:pyrimidine deaminase RibD-like protein